MKTYKHTLAIMACAFTASLSQAATVDVTFDRNVFEGSGFDEVHIYAPRIDQGVLAGRFQGTGTSVVGVPESIFFNGLNDLFMYCFDIYQGIGNKATATYTISQNPSEQNRSIARTLNFLGAVNQVLNKDSKVYDPYAWLRDVNGYQGAAIQLGIWESKYETTDSWNLSGGVFWATGLDKANRNQGKKTQEWLALFEGAMESSNSLDGRYVMILENNRFQDMITADPPTVPEPGTLALLGLGVGGLALARRRKERPAS